MFTLMYICWQDVVETESPQIVWNTYVGCVRVHAMMLCGGAELLTNLALDGSNRSTLCPGSLCPIEGTLSIVWLGS
jgi:hypothetical protein